MALSFLLAASCFIALFVFNSMPLAVGLFFMYWLLWFCNFALKSGPASRGEIAMVTLDSILLSLLCSLAVVHWLLLKLAQ